MKRREFMAGAGAAVIGWPLGARAQQPSLPVIGFLNSATPEGYAPMLAGFQAGLKETGHVGGANVVIEYRWADDRNERLPALAAELIDRKVSVIVANGPAALVAKAATSTVPIVFFGGYNPIAMGLVSSLNRPGGNATGVTILNVELVPKRFELAREIVPTATAMALLVNQTNPNARVVTETVRPAVASWKLDLHILEASSEREIDRTFERAAGLHVGALVISPDPFFNTRSEQFAALTLRHRLPAIYQYREFAKAGGLMSYGGDIVDLYRLVGRYAGRILKGEKPAELPVQQSTKAELFINLKTAKALGLTVPLPLLARADEVIE